MFRQALTRRKPAGMKTKGFLRRSQWGGIVGGWGLRVEGEEMGNFGAKRAEMFSPMGI